MLFSSPIWLTTTAVIFFFSFLRRSRNSIFKINFRVWYRESFLLLYLPLKILRKYGGVYKRHWKEVLIKAEWAKEAGWVGEFGSPSHIHSFCS